jgi:hypothetical protein
MSQLPSDPLHNEKTQLTPSDVIHDKKTQFMSSGLVHDKETQSLPIYAPQPEGHNEHSLVLHSDRETVLFTLRDKKRAFYEPFQDEARFRTPILQWNAHGTMRNSS